MTKNNFVKYFVNYNDIYKFFGKGSENPFFQKRVFRQHLKKSHNGGECIQWKYTESVFRGFDGKGVGGSVSVVGRDVG